MVQKSHSFLLIFLVEQLNKGEELLEFHSSCSPFEHVTDGYFHAIRKWLADKFSHQCVCLFLCLFISELEHFTDRLYTALKHELQVNFFKVVVFIEVEELKEDYMIAAINKAYIWSCLRLGNLKILLVHKRIQSHQPDLKINYQWDSLYSWWLPLLSVSQRTKTDSS